MLYVHEKLWKLEEEYKHKIPHEMRLALIRMVAEECREAVQLHDTRLSIKHAK